MTTIADIAKLAGVAKSTVSRYLNDGSVSGATKKKIERVINETGYAPNAFAQSLKAKNTNIIGTIVPRLDSYAASHTLIGIDEQLKELNYQMLISNSNQNLETEIENIYTLAKQKVAGIILLAAEVTSLHLEAFLKIDIPVLLVGQEHEKVYSVVHDDYKAAHEMGKYILANGHKRIAYLGVTEKDIAVGVKRKAGFKDSMASAVDCKVNYYETGFNIAEALEQVPEIIDTFHPTIIVCATDNIAIGAMKAASLKGYSIPKDLSITGFGGYEITGMIHPGLTTAKFFYKEAGQLAARNIVKLVREEELELLNVSGFQLIVRESVDILV